MTLFSLGISQISNNFRVKALLLGLNLLNIGSCVDGDLNHDHLIDTDHLQTGATNSLVCKSDQCIQPRETLAESAAKSPLHKAALQNDVETLRELLKQGFLGQPSLTEIGKGNTHGTLYCFNRGLQCQQPTFQRLHPIDLSCSKLSTTRGGDNPPTGKS